MFGEAGRSCRFETITGTSAKFTFHSPKKF